MLWGRDIFHARACVWTTIFRSSGRGLITVLTELSGLDGKVRIEFSLHAGFCEHVHEPLDPMKIFRSGQKNVSVCQRRRSASWVCCAFYIHHQYHNNLLLLLLAFLPVRVEYVEFTSAPSRILRDVMPRRKNKYFFLLHSRKTNRISVFQIHFHCLFQFYQTMQGTKYLAGWLIHRPLLRTFRLLKIFFLGLLGCYAALIGGCYGRFGTDYWCHLQGSSRPFWPF